jgi:nucleoside 2-deoxyribosyltransferase
MSELQGTKSLCYLATPYSKYLGGHLERAFVDASKIAAQLLRAGIKVYSPIAHTHPLAVYGNIDPLDHSIWLPFDEAMMEAANILIVAHMDGWQDSKGIAHEIAFFEQRGKPIYDLNPETMTMAKRIAGASGNTSNSVSENVA